MSENNKPSRTIPEIQQEYQQNCTRAGHLQYQIYTLEKDLALVNDLLRNLNFEASAAAPKPEPTSTPEAEKESTNA